MPAGRSGIPGSGGVTAGALAAGGSPAAGGSHAALGSPAGSRCEAPAGPFGPREACGIFGIWGHPEAVACTVRALVALQHRGQESAGIAVLDGSGRLRVHRGPGLVGHVFGRPGRLARLGEGATAAIGHVRYATAGDPGPRNAQPLLFGGDFALAHNGQLAGGERWRAVLERLGVPLATTADSEVIGRVAQRHAALASRLPVSRSALTGTCPVQPAAPEGGGAMAAPPGPGGTNPAGGPPAPLLKALAAVPGAYAVVILTPRGLLAARDPWGIRPLVLGRIGDAWAVASESCALETAGGRVEEELPPGSWVWLGCGEAPGPARGALPGWDRAGLAREAFCVFEYIYFARPDSCFAGRSVYAVRKELGRRLARVHPASADVVVGVPDSSLPAAAGYAEAAGLPHELGLVKNRYTGRTFIRPGAREREEAVRLKLHPVPGVLAGRRVVLVDDSLVRGTTARWLVTALREAGAREVHLRITAPPYRFPCHFGVDTGRAEELLAAGHSPQAMARAVGADSLAFLPLDQVVEATGRPAGSLCLGCFTGRYPLDPEGKVRRIGHRGDPGDRGIPGGGAGGG
ncbi:amidophosphoribosyltransferase [Thermaerobacter subterraneus]|uniref:Amidophosphoribosyltransferase n=1 Tax=Thermaerobacter subterraneus DSM 13965 TaxID=867903 RepID=K6PRV6_9FIRM|nr:amidophosphoribosyltransferase [Thermaerobacter subterraneus]EKP95687.1 glutamine phosphoribosylpyrophosphate amidotransferase [Thermaerobacter subterraneus DSM 13965]